MNSSWRDRPIAESLKLFEEMRTGMIEEGKATLRMKQDMQSDNFNMYDLIAYRIKARMKFKTFNEEANFSEIMILSLCWLLSLFIHTVHSSTEPRGQRFQSSGRAPQPSCAPKATHFLFH